MSLRTKIRRIRSLSASPANEWDRPRPSSSFPNFSIHREFGGTETRGHAPRRATARQVPGRDQMGPSRRVATPACFILPTTASLILIQIKGALIGGDGCRRRRQGCRSTPLVGCSRRTLKALNGNGRDTLSAPKLSSGLRPAVPTFRPRHAPRPTPVARPGAGRPPGLPSAAGGRARRSRSGR